jgi:LmbE family N-acetylglucosaminyl deacetylase
VVHPRSLCLAVLTLVACGDDLAPAPPPLPAAHDLVIVAHQDDDLIFMQPDLAELVAAGAPLTVVYVTAGDASAGIDYADSRVVAVESAYATLAGQPPAAWSCDDVAIDGHAARRCQLASTSITLVFLGYPDGGIDGQAPGSLLHLWEGKVGAVDTVAHQVTRYDRGQLIAAVARIIEATSPAVIHTLDLSGTHGVDHPDHLIVGALAVLARAAIGSPAAIVSYRGYDDGAEPANLVTPVFDQVSLPFRAYEACQIMCGVCEQTPCLAGDLGAAYATWLHRRYAIGTRAGVRGRLALGDRCAVVGADGGVALGDCAGAPSFTIDPGGNLRAGDRCVVVAPDGELGTGACAAAADRDFLLDDEGHLWSGVPPAPVDGMRYDHGRCLADVGDRIAAVLCGAARDPRWTILAPTTTGPRPLAGGGRAVRLGWIDRAPALCDVEAGGLRCAAALTDGGFAPDAARVDAAGAPLAIEPDSLVLGDVDGDGRGDACGRDDGGVLCATAASGFVATRWTAAFARTGPATAADRTLAAYDLDGDGAAELCELTDAGLACAARGDAAATVVTARPLGDTALITGDLDGDGRDDWCAASPDGPACAVAAQRALTRDGASWAFSLAGVVDGSAAQDGAPPDPARAALVDISGDDRADLCVLRGDHVDCAISQGRGFGPRTTLLRVPGGHPTALWAGPPGTLCVDDGPSLVCARYP